MPPLRTHRVKVRYQGGAADDHRLPLYDGTTSILGIAQALQIAVHAYMTDEVVSRATALRGAKMFIKPTQRGSFLFELVTLIETYPATAGISAVVFYDFIKLAFSKATGLLDAEPQTPSLSKDFEKKEPFFDNLAETLEGSLQRVHRPIGDGVEEISVERPRSNLLIFNQATSDWVNTREEVAELITVTGNVTRYNSNTRNGRVYIQELGKIVPFKPGGDFPADNLWHLTWSLHGSNTGLPKQLELEVRYVNSAIGDTKRILVSSTKQLTDQSG